MVDEKYRNVAIPCAKEIDEVDTHAISALNSRFDPDDFHVTCNDQCIDVWLRQVDLSALTEAVNEVRAAISTSLPLADIVSEIEDIRSYGFNGRKRLYVDYNRERKVVGREEKSLRRGKHYYASDSDFPRHRNALPSDYVNRIVCGDSEAVLKQIPENSVDLVFTSPPYNFGLDYGANRSGDDDARDWEAYFAKLFRILDECIRVLSFGGRLIVNVQPLFSDYIPSHHIISSHLMRKHMIWKGEILWEKHNYNCKYTAWGSWKSPASPYLKYTWEFLEVFCKGALKKPGRAVDADIDADSFKKWVVARWSVSPERRMRHYGHPAMFPEELARRVMLLFSFKGDTVLDPFAGVGTTCVVAEENGRRFLGIDVSEEYCGTARTRLADVQKGLFG